MVERKSSILGPDGNPIVIRTLSQEVATPTIAGVRRTHELLATLGWPEAREQLTPQALANGRLHTQLLAWMAEGQASHAELQVSLLVDDKNQAQGYLLLAR